MGGIVGGVLGFISAGKQAKAANKAADIQAEAGRESLAFQREIFETTEANAAPFIDAGGLGLDALLFELGLGDAPTIGGTSGFRVGDQTFDTREEAEKFQKTFEISDPTHLSSQHQVGDGGEHNNLRGTRPLVAPQAPGAIPQIDEFSTGGTPFGGFQESPGFKFALQQGINAVDASAAAGGSLFSGSTLQDLTKFGQGFASQQRGTFLDRLQSLVSVGQTGVGQVAGVGNVFSQTGSQTIEGIGNAQSAGVIGSANAKANQLNSLGTAIGGASALFGDFSGLFSSGSSFAPQTSSIPLVKPF